MKIGVPKEIHAGERRVATTPDVASQLQKLGYNVASDWDGMVKLMQEYNDLDPAAKAESFYTNEFID